MFKTNLNMTLNEYQERAMSTCMNTCDNDAYMFYGLVGEVGEFASKIAKAIRKGQLVFDDDNNLHCVLLSEKDSEDMLDAIKGEIGDCLWMLSGVCNKLGLTLDEVAEHNLAKLASRQQRGIIDGDGDNR